MKNPELSIIIPVYNTGPSAVELVKKLQRGKYQDFEILLIDDGSTDDSLKYLRALTARKTPQSSHSNSIAHQATPKIRLLAQKNQGPSSARNLGLKNAKGKYIIFLDSDDSVDKTFLTKMTSAIKNKNAALAVCGFTYKYPSGKTKTAFTSPLKNLLSSAPQVDSSVFLKNLLFDGRLYSSVNKIFRADVIKKYDLKFNASLNFGEDTMFVLNYLNAAPGDITTVLEPLYHYQISSNSLVAASNKDWQKWQQLYEEVKSWDKNQHKILLRLLKLRWRISWLRRQQK